MLAGSQIWLNMPLTFSYIPFYRGLLVSMALLLLGCSTPPNQQEQVPSARATSTKPNEFKVLAYYTGQPDSLNAKTLESLTHIIYSFAYLEDKQLSLKTASDSASLASLASLKTQYPHLKIMIALGGWGGCKACPAVFATEEGRKAFAASTKTFLDSFKIDGLDLDWEYPAIEGFPEHPFGSEDRENFSLLVEELRQTLGWGYELSFAAGGFPEFLEESVDWLRIMPLLDRVNLMSYDLVNGNSSRTGHHTPLYATSEQQASAQQAVQFLDSLGVDRKKIVIGAAFYARVWEGVPATNHGLYQPGKFKETLLYHQLETYIGFHPNFEEHWDSVAQAPFLYNPNQKVFITYDDTRSIEHKTRYALSQGLGGIMFWQLSGDKPSGDLLQTIHRIKTEQLP
jgi:chitinase